jgi:hypothetical protein
LVRTKIIYMRSSPVKTVNWRTGDENLNEDNEAGQGMKITRCQTRKKGKWRKRCCVHTSISALA